MSYPDFNLELQASCGIWLSGISVWKSSLYPKSNKCAKPMSLLPASLFCKPFIQIHYHPQMCSLWFLYFTKTHRFHSAQAGIQWHLPLTLSNSPTRFESKPSQFYQSNTSRIHLFPSTTAQVTILLLKQHLSDLSLPPCFFPIWQL